MGLAYLADFIAGCEGCRIDFVPIHWYGDAGDVAGFQRFVTQASEVVEGRPLWVTEFGTTSGSAEEIEMFLRKVMEWMDGTEVVERYAWFMLKAGNLINADGRGVSKLGELYISG